MVPEEAARVPLGEADPVGLLQVVVNLLLEVEVQDFSSRLLPILAPQFPLQLLDSAGLVLQGLPDKEEVGAEGLLLLGDVLPDDFLLVQEGCLHHFHNLLLRLEQLLTDPGGDLPPEALDPPFVLA